jgi:plasmid replication initiation protein
MAKLKKNYLVKKRNVLNELRANNMTLQELRFFSIYLSKININDTSTRVVRFSIEDFQTIMELDSRLKTNDMKLRTNSLLGKVVNVPNERGGYSAFQLFKECEVDTDDKGKWYVEINAHDKALPLMFDFQSRYFSYQLWNALRLRSPNQLRMYEILKQYEKIGTRVLGVDKLKELIGIEKKEYDGRFNNFKTKVLNACQQALQENTDLKFDYAPYGKRGKGGKILFLKFTIKKNEDYVDQLTLDEFIEERRLTADNDGELDDYATDDGLSLFGQKVEFLMETCNNEFTFNEMTLLVNAMRNKLPYSLYCDDIQCYDYLCDKYNELAVHADRTQIRDRFRYMQSIIGKDYEP